MAVEVEVGLGVGDDEVEAEVDAPEGEEETYIVSIDHPRMTEVLTSRHQHERGFLEHRPVHLNLAVVGIRTLFDDDIRDCQRDGGDNGEH